MQLLVVDLLGEVQLLGGNKIMDFLTLIDTWWFRLIMLLIEFIIFYYVAKWVAKRNILFYNEKQWKTAEKYEKKIIKMIKGVFIKEKKNGPFI